MNDNKFQFFDQSTIGAPTPGTVLSGVAHEAWKSSATPEEWLDRHALMRWADDGGSSPIENRIVEPQVQG
ncbi:MAG: hypothetical protein ACREQX_08520 [Candidatus Binataceae bacterium]